MTAKGAKRYRAVEAAGGDPWEGLPVFRLEAGKKALLDSCEHMSFVHDKVNVGGLKLLNTVISNMNNLGILATPQVPPHHNESLHAHINFSFWSCLQKVWCIPIFGV